MMVKLGTTDMSALGLRLKEASGLFNFPPPKQKGNDWPDEDYLEALTRNVDWHFGPRTITLDCFVTGDTWADINGALNNISTAIKYDGLKMLFMEHYSYRGYMVRLAQTTIYKPHFYMVDGINAASFRLVFEEPQPFNFQLVFYEGQISGGSLQLDLVIAKLSKDLSLNSDSQQFVTVHTPAASIDVNLEQDDYDETLTLTEAEWLQVVITGDIDAIEDITVSAPVEPREIADYFLRNGTVSYFET